MSTLPCAALLDSFKETWRQTNLNCLKITLISQFKALRLECVVLCFKYIIKYFSRFSHILMRKCEIYGERTFSLCLKIKGCLHVLLYVQYYLNNAIIVAIKICFLVSSNSRISV